MKNSLRSSFSVLALSAIAALTTTPSAQSQNIATVAGGGPPTTTTAGITKLIGSIGAPYAIRQDHLGNTYILDNDFGRVYKIDGSGNLTLFAGNGVIGFSGEGGLAVDASMFDPSGLCIDSLNNVYVADSDNGIVREIPVTTAGGKTANHIYTVAGVQAQAGFTYGGDGGPATSAHLHFPDGCSFDSHNNMFIADRGNNAIRVVSSGTAPAALPSATTAGDIYLFTGSAGATPPNPPAVGSAANGASTIGAALNGPYDVFVDSHDNVFIADFGNPSTTPNNVIREVAAATAGGMTLGDVYIVAGEAMATPGAPATGVVATATTLNGPLGLYVDADENIFFIDLGNKIVREVAGTPASTGMVTGDIYTIGGNGQAGFSGDTGLALSATFTNPFGLFVDSTGSVFIADSSDSRIRQISSSTGSYLTETINTWAGNGQPSYLDATTALDGQLDSPAGVAVDAAGDLLIADVGASGEQSLIRKVATPISTGALSTLIGSAGFNGYVPTNNAPYPNYVENDAIGVTADASNNVYIADTKNCIIRELSGGVLTTVAGTNPTVDVNNPPNSTPNCGLGTPGSAAVGTTLGAVNDVAVDAAGDIFISDSTSNVIWFVPKATVGGLTAGNAYIAVGTANATGSLSGDGGIATSAHLNHPNGIFIDIFGNLFIADTGNNVIREVPGSNTGAMTAGDIYTVAGDNVHGTAGYTGNGGPAVGAEVNAPFSVVVDHAGNVFIADTGNQVIREVAGTTAGGKTAGDIYTVAGTAGTAGFAGDGGAATSAQLNSPEGLALDGAGDLLIGDSINNRVRSVAAIGNEAAVATANFSPNSVTFLPQPVNIASTPTAVTLTNNGGASLTGIAITITGTGAAAYSLAPAGTCTATLAAAASCTINVTFTPASAATFTAALHIADSAVGSPQTVALTGNGITGAPAAVVTPAALTFASQVVGVASAAQMITVSNATGTAPLTLTAITNANFTGANAGDFTQTNTCGTTVAVGATCSISVTFTPTSATPTARVASIAITDNATSSPQTVTLAGTASLALAPAITLNPTSLTSFASAVGTASAAQAVLVTNSGTAALTFTSIAIAGPNAGDFSLGSATTCGGTGTLGAGTNCTLSVVFKPTATGTRTAMIMLADNVTGGTQTVALSGTATSLTLTLGPATGASTSQTVTAGATASYSLQVSANQNASVSFTCTGAPTAAACVVPTTAVAVTAGTPAPVSVTVTTTARGLLVPQSQPATRMQPPTGIPMLPISVLAMLLLIATVLASTQRQLGQAGRLRFARVALSACLVLMPIAAATLIGGCGSGSTTAPPPVTGTPAGTYTVVVTATSGGQTATANLTLIVQ